MKTSVNMVRTMGEFKVTQRTKDAFFNATALVKQWNTIKDNPRRDLSKFWELDNVKEFICVLMKEENLHTPSEVYVKSRASRGINAGTWVHPVLFVKLAMWLSPSFEYHVVKFVADQLIDLRHDAGDHYIGLTNAVQRLENINYSQLAKGLNYIIFGKHEKGLRQNASLDQLNALTDLQKKLAFAVDMGYIRSFEELLNEMRRMWSINKQLR